MSAHQATCAPFWFSRLHKVPTGEHPAVALVRGPSQPGWVVMGGESVLTARYRTTVPAVPCWNVWLSHLSRQVAMRAVGSDRAGLPQEKHDACTTH